MEDKMDLTAQRLDGAMVENLKNVYETQFKNKILLEERDMFLKAAKEANASRVKSEAEKQIMRDTFNKSKLELEKEVRERKQAFLDIDTSARTLEKQIDMLTKEK